MKYAKESIKIAADAMKKCSEEYNAPSKLRSVKWGYPLTKHHVVGWSTSTIGSNSCVVGYSKIEVTAYCSRMLKVGLPVLWWQVLLTGNRPHFLKKSCAMYCCSNTRFQVDLE